MNRNQKRSTQAKKIEFRPRLLIFSVIAKRVRIYIKRSSVPHPSAPFVTPFVTHTQLYPIHSTAAALAPRGHYSCCLAHTLLWITRKSNTTHDRHNKTTMKPIQMCNGLHEHKESEGSGISGQMYPSSTSILIINSSSVVTEPLRLQSVSNSPSFPIDSALLFGGIPLLSL